MSEPFRRFVRTFLLVIALDQFTKWWAARLGAATLNSGVSFALGTEVMTAALVSITIFAAWTIYKLMERFWRAQPILAACFFGGAASNMIDRVLRGGVVDWLPIPFTPLTNNVADWVICAAAVRGIMLLWQHQGAQHVGHHS